MHAGAQPLLMLPPRPRSPLPPPASGALLPGDAVVPAATGLFGGKGLSLGVQPHMLAADAAQAKAAAKRLVEQARGGGCCGPACVCSLPPLPAPATSALPPLRLRLQSGLPWEWLLPFHGGNFSRGQAEELVQGWAPPAREHDQHRPPAATDSHAAGAHGGAAAFLEAHDAAAAGLGLSPGEVPSGGAGADAHARHTEL